MLDTKDSCRLVFYNDTNHFCTFILLISVARCIANATKELCQQTAEPCVNGSAQKKGKNMKEIAIFREWRATA